MQILEFNARNIEGLHTEALVLLQETAQGLGGSLTDNDVPLDDPAAGSLAASHEDAQIRMMLALDWLRAHRDHFVGNRSLFALRFRTALRPMPLARHDHAVAHSRPDLHEIVVAVSRFHDRLVAHDRAWHRRSQFLPDLVQRIRTRLQPGGE